MGTGTSQVLKPEELSEFRKLNPTTTEALDIPERPENRVPTDKKFLLAFVIAILILLPLLIYCIVYADIRRLTGDIDTCGNICGYENKKIDGIECTGKDLRDKPYMQYSANIEEREDWLLIPRECVLECPSSLIKKGYECYPQSSGSNYENNHFGYGRRKRSPDVNLEADFHEVQTNWWKLLLVLAIIMILSFCVMLLCRFSPALVVWTCILLTIGLCISVTGIFWYLYFQDKQRWSPAPAIVFTIFTLIVLLIIIFLFKRVKLVILLLKETTKAIFAMPLILLVPVASVCLQIVLGILFLLTTALIASSGTLKPIEGSSGFYHYEAGIIHSITAVYNLIIALWISQFIVGCYYVVVGGSVGKWYFAKNKRFLDSPIWTATSNLFRFHMGSVAFGSLIVTIVELIRAILRSIAKNQAAKALVDCCMGCIGDIIKFFTKNAYIITAIHGQSFYKSGKRAAKLLLNNVVNLVAVSSITDWVLAIAQLLLIIVGTAIGYFLFNGDPIGTFLSAIIVIIIVIISFTVFSVTNNALFLCFCEDSNINDGMSRPYCMTRGLMEFIETSKQVMGEKKSDF